MKSLTFRQLQTDHRVVLHFHLHTDGYWFDSAPAKVQCCRPPPTDGASAHQAPALAQARGYCKHTCCSPVPFLGEQKQCVSLVLICLCPSDVCYFIGRNDETQSRTGGVFFFIQYIANLWRACPLSLSLSLSVFLTLRARAHTHTHTQTHEHPSLFALPCLYSNEVSEYSSWCVSIHVSEYASCPRIFKHVFSDLLLASPQIRCVVVNWQA
jgi:hypothetical protein